MDISSQSSPWRQFTDSPEVKAALTQDDLVYGKLHILDFDDCITKVALQTEIIKHWAWLVWRRASVTHLEF